MKIIGKGGREIFLVEANEDELAIAAGFRGQFDDGWKKQIEASHHRTERLPVGTKINVQPSAMFASRFNAVRDKIMEGAGALRAMATIVEQGVDAVTPPPEKADEPTP